MFTGVQLKNLSRKAALCKSSGVCDLELPFKRVNLFRAPWSAGLAYWAAEWRERRAQRTVATTAEVPVPAAYQSGQPPAGYQLVPSRRLLHLRLTSSRISWREILAYGRGV
ncbi:uncharacterized protein LOC132902072 [Amyelois transitella]|uniref:uncharacterized protein LOC132902072 n=1 Tax=Amyelois transitella TaxID=680683 RepID=UPI0029907C22|nr:uncharacterized protein LOC132902072 [Amyelois transitella]